MSKALFIAKSVEIAKYVFLEILFDKEMNLDENIECYFRIRIQLDNKRKYRLTKKYRYVYDDNMVSVADIQKFIIEMLKEVTVTLDAIDRGVNVTQEFYLEVPGIDNMPIEIRKDLKKSIGNINEYNIQPFIIDLYTSVLIHYKGTDTLQKRKYEKMIEAQEDALRYMQTRGF